jgi:hypothetical protein
LSRNKVDKRARVSVGGLITAKGVGGFIITEDWAERVLNLTEAGKSRYEVETILTVMYKGYGRRSVLFVESRRAVANNS